MAGNFMSGFFGGGPQGNQQQQAEPEPEEEYVDDNQEPSIHDAIGDIFAENPPEEEDPNPQPIPPVLGPDGKPLPTREQQLAADIQRMIAGISVKEEDIPADFNASDPKMLRDLLSKTQQTAAMATVQMVMKPMQIAFEQFSKDMKDHVTQELSGFGGRQTERTTLESIVPEAGDPKLKGLVDMLFTQAKQKKGSTATQAAQAVRKGLDAMGIKSQARADDPMSGGFKTGDSALDIFAPLKPRVAPTQVRRGQAPAK